MVKRSVDPQRGFFPQPAYLIGAFREDGEPNFTLVTWITFCCVNPPTLMFSSRGKRMTSACVLRTELFSANLVTTGMLPVADYCGNTSGFNTNKCLDTGASWSRGVVLDVPVLEDSPWIFECALVRTVEHGDSVVFFGEVKNILVDERIPDPAYGKVDMAGLDPVIYAPVHYYNVGQRVGSVGDSKRVFAQR
ncbi:MAG: flavin reductase family protein [Bacillota bacterium]|nr:flavin reductase family protein [Bacillota bacterium]